MSYHSITLLEGNLCEPPTDLRATRTEFEGIELHLDGTLVIENVLFRPGRGIDHVRIAGATVFRPAWSDTVEIKTDDQTFGLRYLGYWPFKEWQRLIPATSNPPPLHGEAPSMFAQSLCFIEHAIYATSYYMVFLMNSVLAGFGGGNRRES